MNTKNCVITVLSSIALVACFAGAGSDAHAQGISVSTYELKDLGGFPEQKVPVSTATAINTSGEVTGISGRFAFCYDSSEKEPMEKLGIDFRNSVNRAFGMNDYDQVVGDSMFVGKERVSHAALFYNGSVIDLGVLGGRTTFWTIVEPTELIPWGRWSVSPVRIRMVLTAAHLCGARLRAWSTSEHWAGHTHRHSRSMMRD